jgi:hypothetical protein
MKLQLLPITIAATIAGCALSQSSHANTTLYFPLGNASFPLNHQGNENIGNNVRRTSQSGDPRPVGCVTNCRHTRGDSYILLNRGETMTAVAIADGHVTTQSDYPGFPLLLNGVSRTAGGVFSLTFEVGGVKHIARYPYLDPEPLQQFSEGQYIKAGTPISTITGRNYPGTMGTFLYVEIHFQDENGEWQEHPDPLRLLRGARERKI